MKTIIKIPLYVEIETKEDLDRKLVSDCVRNFFIPAFYESIKISDPSRFFSGSVFRNMDRMIGSNSKYRFLTEAQLFTAGVKKNESKQDLDDLMKQFKL